MLEVTENASGRFIELRLTGKLTKEAYESFVPMTEAQIKEHGKVRILVELHDFHGWTAAAAWEDTKFGFKHFRDIERIAIVGETQWEKGMSVFCKPFTWAKIKYFDRSEIDNAREWLRKEKIPMHHQLMKEERILILAPEGPLQTEDFNAVAREVDSFIEENGNLEGVMIEAESFPGWANFSSLLAHFRFVRDHHKNIRKVAVVSDSSVLSHLPQFASHFVSAEAKHFPYTEKVAALEWLQES